MSDKKYSQRNKKPVEEAKKTQADVPIDIRKLCEEIYRLQKKSHSIQ